MKTKSGKSGKKKFVYRKPSDAAIQSRANQSAGGFDSPVKSQYTQFMPKAGKFRVRFLPPTAEGMETWGMEVFQHYGVGPDKNRYLCNAKMKHDDSTCSVCVESARAAKDGEDELAKELKAKKKVACWVIDRKNTEAGPLLWFMPWQLERDIAALSSDEDTGAALYIDDPDKGFDVMFEVTGSGLSTKYISPKISRKATPISDDEDQQSAWLEYITENPIPETLNFFDSEYITKVLGGEVESDGDEDEDDDEPKRGKAGKKKPGKKPKPSDDEDDEDQDDESDDESDDEDDEDDATDESDDSDADDDEDGDEDAGDDDDGDGDDEDDDEPPAKKPGKKSGKKKPDPDEDDDEDDADDEGDDEDDDSSDDEDGDGDDESDDDEDGDDEDDDEDEDEPAPKPKAGKKPGKKSPPKRESLDDDDEDESDDEDDDGDEDDEPAPKKPKSGKAKPLSKRGKK